MPKKSKLNVGDIFLIPRRDGYWVVEQVLEQWLATIVCVGVFDFVVSEKSLSDDFYPSNELLLAMPSVSSIEIVKGFWPRSGNRDLIVNIEIAPHRRFAEANYAGASWQSGLIVEDFVNAYYGLGSCEPYPGRPGALKSMLLSKSK